VRSGHVGGREPECLCKSGHFYLLSFYGLRPVGPDLHGAATCSTVDQEVGRFDE
jgi:hypothetical protein